MLKNGVIHMLKKWSNSHVKEMGSFEKTLRVKLALFKKFVPVLKILKKGSVMFGLEYKIYNRK